MSMNKCELLSPAGSINSVYAAINSGADAIYMGTEKFSARAFAENPSVEEYVEAIKLCHLYGVKVYLTLNIIIFSDEMDEVIPLIKPLYEVGLDGVIIQDIGVAYTIKKHFPLLPIHASTQMSIMNSSGALEMSKLGFERIVPARELTLDEVIEMKKNTGLEMECFIHGAMCYSYSGLCLMSSMIGGRSGNRGKCAGTCRLPFVYNENRIKNDEYPLSMKDMCTIEYIHKLIDAGIDSFKIEGRMKSPEYVAGVTSLYRKYIDKYYSDPEDIAIEPSDLQKLRGLYMRTQICQGFYEGGKGRNLITMSMPGYKGNDESYIELLNQKYVHKPNKKLLDMTLYMYADSEISLVLSCENIEVCVNGVVASKAQNAPLTKERVLKQLSKTGDTNFSINKIDINMGEDVFVPMSSINELRRSGIDELQTKIIESKGFVRGENKYKLPDKCNIVNKTLDDTTTKIDVSVKLKSHLDAFCNLELSADRLYIDHTLIGEIEHLYKLLHNLKSNKHTEIFVSLPFVYRHKDKKYWESLINQINEYAMSGYIEGILVHTIDELALINDIKQKNNLNIKIVTDTSIYLCNSFSVHALTLLNELSGITVSHEMMLKDTFRLLDNESLAGLETSIVIYGRVPMMISANCVKNTYGKCNHQITLSEDSYICDRMGNHFPVNSDCTICTNIIYNDRPTSLHNYIDKLINSPIDRFRIDLTCENVYESLNIINSYNDVISGNVDYSGFKNSFSNSKFTTGHIKRGV